MNRNAIINQLRPRFRNDGEWALFLAFIEDHRVRGDAEEIWLQWDIHLLKRQAGQRPWHSQDNRFLPESMLMADAPIF